jgi:hypothetical protein
MTDYITALEDSLRLAAAREYASQSPSPSVDRQGIVSEERPTRPSRRSRWWRSPMAIFAILILGGASTAAAVTLLTERSAP